MSKNITVCIDNQQYEASSGESIIQVSDRVGVYIPRFCYHQKLTVVANCRMCLVEVEKAPKPLPACATPVADGMVIYTRSKSALAAQRDVMSFLLINHPLDCPICDQGGECDLQDLALAYGNTEGSYDQPKRAVVDEDLGPLVATEMTRCIHCTRCVRFGEEIAGMPELGVMSRGGKAYIGTYLNKQLHSELSGNIIDLCPVGALTAKPSRFNGRSWSFKQFSQIARHDFLGSNIYCHVSSKYMNNKQDVMRVIPKTNEKINQVWLSDRDRFSYEGLKHNRLLQPQIKTNGKWQVVSWQVALDIVTDKLSAVIHKFGAESVAGFISPNATLEEGFLFQNWLRSLQINNIDHRLKQHSQLNALNLNCRNAFSVDLVDVANSDVVILLEAYPRRRQPMLNHYIRQAAENGAHIVSLGSKSQQANYSVTTEVLAPVSQLVAYFASLAKALAMQSITNEVKHGSIASSLSAIEVVSGMDDVAKSINSSEKVVVILGEVALQHPHAKDLLIWARAIADSCDVELQFITEGANTQGMYLAGCLPDYSAGASRLHNGNKGLSAYSAMQKGMKSYILHDLDISEDIIGDKSKLDSSAFNIVISPFNSEANQHFADIMLPCSAGYETAGTVINGFGDWQFAESAVLSPGETRPGWKIYSSLFALFNNEQGLKYDQLELVTQEVKSLVKVSAEVKDNISYYDNSFNVFNITNDLWCIVQQHDYQVDNLVRNAKSLQASFIDKDNVRCNLKTAKLHRVDAAGRVKISQNDAQVSLPIIIDNNIADNTLLVPVLKENGGCFVTGKIKMEAV